MQRSEEKSLDQKWFVSGMIAGILIADRQTSRSIEDHDNWQSLLASLRNITQAQIESDKDRMDDLIRLLLTHPTTQRALESLMFGERRPGVAPERRDPYAVLNESVSGAYKRIREDAKKTSPRSPKSPPETKNR